MMCENIAYNNSGSDSADITVNGWINSPGHCKNLKSSTNVSGIGVFRSEDGLWYYTQLFARMV